MSSWQSSWIGIEMFKNFYFLTCPLIDRKWSWRNRGGIFPFKCKLCPIEIFLFVCAGNRILISLFTELRILKSLCQCSDERCVQTGWIEQSMETCSFFHLLFGIWVYVFAFFAVFVCIYFVFPTFSGFYLYFVCFFVQYEWIKQSTDHCSTFLSPLICSIVCNEISGRLPETSSIRNLSCLSLFKVDGFISYNVAST